MRRSVTASLYAVASASALLASSPAHAGGIGVTMMGGLHSDRVYSYTYNEDTAQYDQFIENQMNPNYGAGFEFILGDKDNKISGMFRAFPMFDAPLADPEKGDTFAIRKVARAIGMMDAGLQFGFLGDPGQIQMTAVGSLGSGFLTTDYTPFIQVQAGVGGTWMAARHVQVAAAITGGARYRRTFYPITSLTLGVRYLFD